MNFTHPNIAAHPKKNYMKSNKSLVFCSIKFVICNNDQMWQTKILDFLNHLHFSLIIIEANKPSNEWGLWPMYLINIFYDVSFSFNYLKKNYFEWPRKPQRVLWWLCGFFYFTIRWLKRTFSPWFEFKSWKKNNF